MLLKRNTLFARSLAVAAVLVLPAIVLFGWWVIALAIALAAGAAAAMPVPPHQGRSRRIRETIHAIQRRLNPHLWRPGG
jgi:hypothetical protein